MLSTLGFDVSAPTCLKFLGYYKQTVRRLSLLVWITGALSDNPSMHVIPIQNNPIDLVPHDYVPADGRRLGFSNLDS